MIFGLVLLLSEAAMAFQSTLFNVTLFNPSRRVPPELPDDPPNVDVLITTYNESASILRRTMAACKNLNYPSSKLHIWVCDDGRREEVRRLARDFEVGYITRNSNEHAKAGNLNNALGQTHSEIFVTLDADMIAKPTFLQRTVGFFEEKDLAFVQLPQSFYNRDIFQHNLFQSESIPNEQDMFMRTVQPGRDRYNATIYIGSNTVFRRSTIESIGGFATGTITEDLATGMLLQARGYKTFFLNEVLVQGLSAESFPDFLNQRIRWARGTIQTVRRWNPLSIEGLSPMQRLLYVSSLLYWYNGLVKFVFVLAPLLYLLLGIILLNASVEDLLIFWLPQFVLADLVFRTCTGQVRNFYWSHVYETATAPAVLWAVLVETFARSPIGFHVTPKGLTKRERRFFKGIAIPHIVLALLSILALVRGIVMVVNEGWGTGWLAIVLFWVVYNLSGLLIATMLAWEPPRFRSAERFSRSYPVDLSVAGGDGSQGDRTVRATTVDVSENGCLLRLDTMEYVPSAVRLTVYGHKVHRMVGRVVHFDSHSDGFLLSVSFEALAKGPYQDWIGEVYGEIPGEEQFRLRQGSGVYDTFRKFLANLRTVYRARMRTSPRVRVSVACVIRPLSVSDTAFAEMAAASETTAQPEAEPSSGQSSRVAADVIGTASDSFGPGLHGEIVDIGFGGCRVRVGVPVPLHAGARIHIDIPSLGTELRGQIVRIAPAGQRGTIIGIRFVSQSRVPELLRSLVQ